MFKKLSRNEEQMRQVYRDASPEMIQHAIHYQDLKRFYRRTLALVSAGSLTLILLNSDIDKKKAWPLIGCATMGAYFFGRSIDRKYAREEVLRNYRHFKADR